MFMLMDELMFPIDLMNLDHEHKKLMDFVALATRDDYRGRGIAGELVNQAFEVCVTT